MTTPTRQIQLSRKTGETKIEVCLNLDGTGQSSIETGVGFFDHMLELFSRHGLIDLTVHAEGDLDVDQHHTVEDVGIVLGQAIEKAVGDKRGINRYGQAVIPMDETLAEVAIDLSGRPALVFNARFNAAKIGQFDVQLVQEFFKALANTAGMNLHVNVRYGDNDHHIAEAIFKAFARALRTAVSLDPRNSNVPSTKGTLKG